MVIESNAQSRLHAGCVEACPGCAHREISAAESAERKHKQVKRAIIDLVSDGAIHPVLAPPLGERLGYRDRSCLHARWNELDKRWEFGLLAKAALPGEDPFFVAIPDCPLHTPRVSRVIQTLSRTLPKEIPLHYALISGPFVTFVLKTSIARLNPMRDLLTHATAALAESGEIAGVLANFNPATGRRVLSTRHSRLLWGADRMANPHWIGPTAFGQVSTGLHLKSLKEAEAFLAPRAGDSIVDLYSGIGTSLALWAKNQTRCIGVELSSEAVDCARRTLAETPGPIDASVLQGRVEERLPQLRAWSIPGPLQQQRRLLYMNPPRNGSHPHVLHWVRDEFQPERIAYLSCNVRTLARDLAVLTGRATFRIIRIQPYDFFPLTHHVESLALLDRTPL